MQLDHFVIRVPPAKFEAVVQWLITSMQHMGFREHARPVPNVVGLGADWSWFWVNGMAGGDDEGAMQVLKGLHIAFRAESGLLYISSWSPYVC